MVLAEMIPPLGLSDKLPGVFLASRGGGEPVSPVTELSRGRSDKMNNGLIFAATFSAVKCSTG
jgi:hypothetical protein